LFRHSLPLDHILQNARVQVAEGGDTVMLTTEDLFLYEQGPQFEANVPALKRLFEAVAGIEGLRHIILSHATLAPVVRDPSVIEELSPIAVGMSVHQHEDSTHPNKRYASMIVGIETGSPRLCRERMKGKAYPFRPEQWPDVVLKAMEILNKHNWFPLCTFIVGMPGETPADTKHSLDLLFALKDAKWCVVPALFVPMEGTRMASLNRASLSQFTDLQWEFFFTCWRYNLDFFRRSRTVQWKYNLGIPAYYYLLGRRLFGPVIKYPLLRLAHFPERMLRRRLYLDFSGDSAPKLRIPATVEVPGHNHLSAFPILPD
jgi:radical SAM superfamily enzyme YgiQ (UPF0313 family)